MTNQTAALNLTLEWLWHDFGMDLEWFRDDLGTILGWLWDDFPNLLRQAKDGEILFSLAMIFLEFSNVLLSPKGAIQKIRTGNLGKSRTKTYKVESINNPKWNQKRYQFGCELCSCSIVLDSGNHKVNSAHCLKSRSYHFIIETISIAGPGEVCGGKNERYGICGEGLMCSNCQRCQGCSLKTFECFDDRQCIWSVP